jgi:hypothetical protein
MSVIQNNLLMTPEGYQISRSVRLRSSASAYFDRSTAVTGNRQKLTWSGWVKRGALGSSLFNLFANGAASVDYIGFNADSLRVSFAGGTSAIQTTAVYRDPSAFYHVIVAIDTTQATAANRVLVWVNGVAVTSFSSASYPTQNANTSYNTSGTGMVIGQVGSANYFDGYLTEVNFIDGQALTPSSFGETDAVTGVWKPKKYAGTYGTNGFYLNFSDNSAATAAAIGKDSSGNGNNWTPNNISVTSGVTYDSMLDTPTPYADGGNGRGNYAVVNPLDKDPSVTVSEGNLAHTTGASWLCSRGNFQLPTSGKWYWETTIGTTTSASVGASIGVCSASAVLNNFNTTGQYQAQAAATGNLYSNGTQTASTLGVFSAGDIIQIAADCDNGKIWIGKNNVFWNSTGSTTGNPSGNTNETFAVSPINLFPFTATYQNTVRYNFGQRPFAYTPPTGFKALNTQNLPDATIKKASSYFNIGLYTGNGGTQSLTQLGFQPDFVWNKARANTEYHVLMDSVRTPDKALYSNATNAEDSGLGNTFTSTGMNVTSTGNINTNGISYVYWGWKESVTAGFDIVTYTGTGVNRTIAHGLGVAPKMIIAKHTNAVDNWIVYHASLGGSPDYLWLNLTSAKGTSSAVWNTAPTSSVFGVGTDNLTNLSGGTYVAYLFAEVAGFSKFGSYTGNGSADGPFVYLGFRPRFVMIKNASGAYTWITFDSARGTYNVNGQQLYPNTSDAEATDNVNNCIDFLSNGFKFRGASAVGNGSGNTIIYAAFAENPFKNSLAR